METQTQNDTMRRAPLLVVFLALVGCAWGVPADPGLHAKMRRANEPAPAQQGLEAVPGAQAPSAPAPPPAAQDAGAAAIYYDRCARCHEAFAPSSISAAAWPIYVARYGPRAGLFGAERQRVLRWLQANAR